MKIALTYLLAFVVGALFGPERLAQALESLANLLQQLAHGGLI